MSFIFSTSSYAFGLGLDHKTSQYFGEVYESMGIRFVHHISMSSLKKDLEKVRFLVGIHVAQNFDHSTSELSKWNFALDDSRLEVEQRIQLQIDKLRPLGLEHLAQNALLRVLPNFFSQELPDISEKHRVGGDEFDLLIQCDSSAWPYVGRCLLYVRYEKIFKFLQDVEMSLHSRKSVVDLLKEVVNQFLGVMNQSLTKLGYSCRVGLPLVFTQLESKALTSTGLFIPYIHIGDENSIFDLYFGFVNSSAGAILNLSEAELSMSVGDVDYL